MTETNTYAVVLTDKDDRILFGTKDDGFKEDFTGECVLDLRNAMYCLREVRLDPEDSPKNVEVRRIIFGDELSASEIKPHMRELVIELGQLADFEVEALQK